MLPATTHGPIASASTSTVAVMVMVHPLATRNQRSKSRRSVDGQIKTRGSKSHSIQDALRGLLRERQHHA